MNPLRRFYNSLFAPKQAAALVAVEEGGILVPDPQAPLFKGEPIPSYPDRGVAVPAASPDLLMESQSELIDRLHQASAFSYDEFDRLLRPAIRNYASYAHLLPASESNHHCGQGGLFRHGLEVACNAAIACESKVFAMDRWASERHHLVPRWRLCAILGGMVHDMGKPLIDVGAIDSTGDHQWNPHTGSLWDWLQQNNLEHYYIHWRPGARFKRHEAFTNLALYRIVPQTTLDWVGEHGGQDAFDALVMALTGLADPQNPLSELIRKADSKSVDRDIKDSRQRLSASGLGGQRNLALRLVRFIHDSIEAGTWPINKIGSLIWYTDEGVFGFYPQVLNEAVKALREQGETGIPTDVSKSLTTLSDWGYIHPRLHGNGQSSDTWNMRIHATDRGKPAPFDFQFVRFARDDILPSAILPPATLHAELLGADGQPAVSGLLSHGTLSEPAAVATPASPAAGPTDVGTAPPDILQQVEVALAKASKPSTSAPNAGTPAAPTVDDDAPLRDRGSEPDVRTAQLEQAHANFHSTFPPTSPEGAMAWLLDAAQQPEGDALIKIAKRVEEGLLKEGMQVFDVNDRIYLRSPEAFRDLGWAEPADFRLRLEQRNWTEKESPTASRTTVGLEYQGKKIPCTRLTETHSQIFRLLLPARSPDSALKKPATAARSSVPLGPRISAELAARLHSLTEYDSADAPLIRPILHNYLLEIAKERGTHPEQVGSDHIQSALNAFIRMHNIRGRRWYLQHVLSGSNTVCLSQAQDRGADEQVKHELRINPDYDVDQDREEAEAGVVA